MDEPIAARGCMSAIASALPESPTAPVAEAAISAGLEMSAGLTAMFDASVPVKNAPPGLPFRS